MKRRAFMTLLAARRHGRSRRARSSRRRCRMIGVLRTSRRLAMLRTFISMRSTGRIERNTAISKDQTVALETGRCRRMTTGRSDRRLPLSLLPAQRQRNRRCGAVSAVQRREASNIPPYRSFSSIGSRSGRKSNWFRASIVPAETSPVQTMNRRRAAGKAF